VDDVPVSAHHGSIAFVVALPLIVAIWMIDPFRVRRAVSLLGAFSVSCRHRRDRNPGAVVARECLFGMELCILLRAFGRNGFPLAVARYALIRVP